MEYYSDFTDLWGNHCYYDWANTCPAPNHTLNLYYAMLHEIGHALGFSIYDTQAPAGTGSVMEQYACYTRLQPLDSACARFLYPSNPASRVAYFSPMLQGGGVAIKWQSKYEYETSHFCVDKRAPDGSYKRISGTIAASGTAHAGASYEFLDPAGTRSDTYRLIEVDENGTERSISEEGVATAERSAGARLSLSRAERDALKKDIAAMLDKEADSKGPAFKAAESGEIDWLAIYPIAFSDAIAPLITYRNYHGFNAAGISYESLVSQYGTIKSYLQYLWNSQGHKLKYVLLVGDNTQIPIDVCNDGDVGGGGYC